MEGKFDGSMPSLEKRENPPFTLRLHIIRHGEKAGGHDVPQDEDLVMRLTPKGRQQAREKGLDAETTGGVASGSSRLRTRETALHMSQVANREVSGEETYEELVEKVGSTPWTNKLLDMPFDKDHPDFDIVNQKANEGIYFQYLVEKDKKIRDADGDRGASIYGTQARNIASLVNRFMRIAEKMGERLARAEEKGEAALTEREQNMGTHGGVCESFLAEVVRRTLGEEEFHSLLKTIPNGSEVTQGMDVDIKAVSGQKPTLHIRFSVGKGSPYTYNQEVPISVVKDIINDFSPREE